MTAVEKHTPGPWSLAREHSPDDSYGHWYHRITAGHGYSENGFEISGILNPHDARLIAAAPELYEALDETERYFSAADGISEDEYVYRQRVRSALAKARGAS